MKDNQFLDDVNRMGELGAEYREHMQNLVVTDLKAWDCIGRYVSLLEVLCGLDDSPIEL